MRRVFLRRQQLSGHCLRRRWQQLANLSPRTAAARLVRFHRVRRNCFRRRRQYLADPLSDRTVRRKRRFVRCGLRWRFQRRGIRGLRQYFADPLSDRSQRRRRFGRSDRGDRSVPACRFIDPQANPAGPLPQSPRFLSKSRLRSNLWQRTIPLRPRAPISPPPAGSRSLLRAATSRRLQEPPSPPSSIRAAWRRELTPPM